MPISLQTHIYQFKIFEVLGKIIFTLLNDWQKWTFWCMTLKFRMMELLENLLSVLCDDSNPQQLSWDITTISVMLLMWTRYLILFDALHSILFSQGAPIYNVIWRSVKSCIDPFIQNPFINFEKHFLTNWGHSIWIWQTVIRFSTILQSLTPNQFVSKTVISLKPKLQHGLVNTIGFQCL